MMLFQGHEESEIIQPGGAGGGAECFKPSAIVHRGSLKKLTSGQLEQRGLPGNDTGKVDLALRERRHSLHCRRIEPALFDQALRANEQWIAREC
jgi:hypothetical protein